MDNGSLGIKSISELKGEFCVPAYQRGYRWEYEVTQLLEDVTAYKDTDAKCCLQPIVVKNTGNERYELIDGQQRLTTIFLIYKVMAQYIPSLKNGFRLSYGVRERSERFLKDISIDSIADNVDFYYMKKAFVTVSDWFEEKEDPEAEAKAFYRILSEKVEVIWYEVGPDADGNELFRRLNIGKIPLTNAELVKALFLGRSGSSGLTEEKRIEIALQWDVIERQLNDRRFWYFLSNDSERYQTRIDLILELIAKCGKGSHDSYKTFFYFDKLRKERSLVSLWEDILRTYLILQDWYNDRDHYHKIGFLVATGTDLGDIFNDAEGEKKSVFMQKLDARIKNRMSRVSDYGELSYENESDRHKIEDLLLLFNVESVRLQSDNGQRFMFDKFKSGSWSLEHIHAQQSEELNSANKKKEWLKWQRRSLQTVGKIRNIPDLDELLSKTDLYSTEEFKLDDRTFADLRTEIEKVLSEDSKVMPIHSVSNLTLLEKNDNSVLNNSTFDVKRNKIIEMDREGKFIPHCTKMVFLKYYTDSDDSQLFFWGKADRKGYIRAINETLKDYIYPISEEE